MIWILENKDNERYVVSNMAGFAKLRPFDPVVARFDDSVCIHQLPIWRAAGQFGALLLLIEHFNAYPHVNAQNLRIVGLDGVATQVGDKIHLAKMTGSARRTIVDRMMGQRWHPPFGWICHS